MRTLSEIVAELRSNRLVLFAAAAVILTAAAFLFYLNGEKDTISLSEAERAEEETAAASDNKKTSKVFVDISGCVKNPGVYEVDPGCRIFQVIEKAGGVTGDADTSVINQAEPVSDGLKVVIPDKNQTADPAGRQYGGTPAGQETGTARININTADSASLQEIPGIGPVTAEKIIAYREQNGLFRSVEDIRNVSGIGDKTYEKMKSMITV